MPLGHTVELNAATVDTEHRPAAARHLDLGALGAGSRRRSAGSASCGSTRWPASARTSERGGGGLTPSDIAPARLTQQQIDELQAARPDRRRPAADPAAAGTALPRQHRAGPRRSSDVYAVQLDITITGPLDADRLRERGAHGGRTATPTWPPGSANSSTSRCRSSRPIPTVPWRYVDLSEIGTDLEEQIQRLCAAERAAVCDLADAAGVSGGADPHRTRPSTGWC